MLYWRQYMPRNNFLLLMLFAVAVSAAAKDKNKGNGRPPCATTYSVVEEDKLGNVRQGISNPKNLKWADKDLRKKYPDVCYAAPDPSVKTVFLITVTPATYQGTRVVTNRETTPTSGTVTDTTGQQVGTYEGTQTSTSSTAVPYSFEYGRFMLTVETFGDDGKPVAKKRFEQNGIYHTMYGIPLGGRGHHPAKALVEDAVKWIHGGGLEDPLQSVQ
jgi:hypothetical protein